MYHLKLSKLLYQHYVQQKSAEFKTFWIGNAPQSSLENISVITARFIPDKGIRGITLSTRFTNYMFTLSERHMGLFSKLLDLAVELQKENYCKIIQNTDNCL